MSPSVEAWSEWGMTQIGGQESCVMSQAIYYFGENTRHSAVMHCSNHTAKVSFFCQACLFLELQEDFIDFYLSMSLCV